MIGALALLAALAPALLGVVFARPWRSASVCARFRGTPSTRARDAGVDYHGRIYNRLWFNDGFHAAHHRAPGADWRGLAADAARTTRSADCRRVRWAEALPALANRAAARLARLARTGHAGHPGRPAPPAARARRGVRGAAVARRTAPDPRGDGDRRRAVSADRAGARPAAAAGALHHRRSRAAHVAGARRQIARAGLADRVASRSAASMPAGPAACDLLVLPLAFRGERAASTGIPLPRWSRSTTGAGTRRPPRAARASPAAEADQPGRRAGRVTAAAGPRARRRAGCRSWRGPWFLRAAAGAGTRCCSSSVSRSARSGPRGGRDRARRHGHGVFLLARAATPGTRPLATAAERAPVDGRSGQRRALRDVVAGRGRDHPVRPAAPARQPLAGGGDLLLVLLHPDRGHRLEPLRRTR